MVPRMHTASPKYPACPSLVPVPEARPPQLAGAAKCWVLPGELARAVESGGTPGAVARKAMGGRAQGGHRAALLGSRQEWRHTRGVRRRKAGAQKPGPQGGRHARD